MIAAAVYARISHAESRNKSEESSVVRQVALGRAFAESQGWTVIDEYVDDGISGRETAKLVTRACMLAEASAGRFLVARVAPSSTGSPSSGSPRKF